MLSLSSSGMQNAQSIYYSTIKQSFVIQSNPYWLLGKFISNVEKSWALIKHFDIW